jgi:hypothetical protein
MRIEKYMRYVNIIQSQLMDLMKMIQQNVGLLQVKPINKNPNWGKKNSKRKKQCKGINEF